MVTRQALRGKRHRFLLAGFLVLALLLSACQMAPLTLTQSSSLTPPVTGKISTPSPTTRPTAQSETALPATTAAPNCLASGGRLVRDQFFSEELNADLPVHIYLPPCFDPSSEQRYPVLYLLHGLSYDHDQWLELGLVDTLDRLIAARDLPPCLVVLPQEAIFAPPQTSRYGDALTMDLIPWVDAHYPTRAERAYRALGGLSRGAAWAVKLGFEPPHLFGRVGAHSLALFEADGGRLTAWMTQTPADDLPLFFIDIGQEDRAWHSARDFADLLDQHNIPHEWYLFAGEHTDAYWTKHLPHYLQWYGQGW